MITSLSPTASWPELSAAIRPVTPLMEPLTPAERMVAAHVKMGFSNKEIAQALGKSEATVKHQVASILGKLSVPTRSRLIAALHESAKGPICP